MGGTGTVGGLGGVGATNLSSVVSVGGEGGGDVASGGALSQGQGEGVMGGMEGSGGKLHSPDDRANRVQNARVRRMLQVRN